MPAATPFPTGPATPQCSSLRAVVVMLSSTRLHGVLQANEEAFTPENGNLGSPAVCARTVVLAPPQRILGATQMPVSGLQESRTPCGKLLLSNRKDAVYKAPI